MINSYFYLFIYFSIDSWRSRTSRCVLAHLLRLKKRRRSMESVSTFGICMNVYMDPSFGLSFRQLHAINFALLYHKGVRVISLSKRVCYRYI